jgi:hypothetical protein
MRPVDIDTCTVEEQLDYLYHHKDHRFFVISIQPHDADLEEVRRGFKHNTQGVAIFRLPQGKTHYLLWGEVLLSTDELWYLRKQKPPKDEWKMW